MPPLQSLASTFSVVRHGPQLIEPGAPVTLELVPSSADQLQVTEVVPAAVDLTWISKAVRFNTHGVEPAMLAEPFDTTPVTASLVGGMPARVPILAGTGFQDLNGTPGELGQLAGRFPVAVQVPVELHVSWMVLDTDGTTVLNPGPDTFTAPSGMNAPVVSLVFTPPVVDATSTAGVPVARRFIRATVALTAGTDSHSFSLPDVPVDIPALAIPKVAVFFMHRNFAPKHGDTDGAAFIVVPNNSPLKSAAELQELLNLLDSRLSTLTSIAKFAAFLLGVQELAAALAAQPHVQFRSADGSNNYDNFNNVTLYKRFLGWLFGWTNIEAEDELSSLIFIAGERSQVRCFRDRNRKGRHFTLQSGVGLHVLIRDLHTGSPAVEPSTPPIGGSIALDSGSSSFGDSLSSLSFL